MSEINPDSLPQFKIPNNIINQLFELTGGAEKFKGLIFACATEDGNPLIYTKYDSQMTELALRKSVECYLQNLDEQEYLDLGEDFD